MPFAKLVILDEVNIQFEELPPTVRRKLVKALEYFVPYAKFLPAYRLGRWNGMISFCTVGGRSYLNLLDKLLPILVDEGYDIDIDDRRTKYNFEFPQVDENYLANNGIVWPENHDMAHQPILLRDYQVESINKFLENLQSIQQISTGAGKTLLTATLSSIIGKYGRTLVIVPSKSLVDQTETDYRALGLDVGVYYGDRKEPGHDHIICTWQSLNIMDKKTKEETAPIEIQDFIEGVVCVMVDEVHSAKADILKRLLTGPFKDVPIRFGLTGTVPKEEFEFNSLLASIGPVTHKILAHELQAKDVLAQCNIEVLQLVDNKEFKNYFQEYDFLVNDPERLKWIAKFIQEIIETGNTLILIGRIPTGKILESLIPNSIFIHGSTDNDDRIEHYDQVRITDDKVIIATYGVASVGINLPRIFNLVLLEPGKSFIRVIQSIGRGIRKSTDKDHVQIWDITSTCKYSKRHLGERKKFYNEAQYPHKTTKVEYKVGLFKFK